MIVFGFLATVVASMIFVAGGGIPSAHAQASNVSDPLFLKLGIANSEYD
ncbi:MAG: hypothetical protein WA323_08880 [Candidatus Nitrosopolaris sp.]